MGALHLLAPTLAITFRPLSFTFEIAVKSFSFPIAFETLALSLPLGWSGTIACPLPVSLAPVAPHVLSDSTNLFLGIVVVAFLLVVAMVTKRPWRLGPGVSPWRQQDSPPSL